MRKFGPIWRFLLEAKTWIDDHLSWFFTNGNKVTFEEEPVQNDRQRI